MNTIKNTMNGSDVPFWFEDPLILFNKTYIAEFMPSVKMTRNQKLNAITRLILLLTIVGFAFSQRVQILISGVCAIIILAIVWKYEINLYGMSGREGLTNRGGVGGGSPAPTQSPTEMKPAYTRPTKENPLMNVLVNEVQDNPTRLSAEPSYDPSVEKEINEKTQDFVVEQFNNDPKVRELLFGDMVETMEFDQSMRNFYATPATTVPNDQGAFAQFLYGGHISCKEGNPLACEKKMFNKYPVA